MQGNGFRWYWLLESETTVAFLVLGASSVILFEIPVWTKIVCIVALGMARDRARRYRDRLCERLGSEWMDRPKSWKVFWWLFTVIVLVATVLLEEWGQSVWANG